MRSLIEEGSSQHVQLLLRQGRHRTAQQLRFLNLLELLIGWGDVVSNERRIIHVEFRAFAPVGIDAHIARDCIDPCRHVAASRIELAGLVPHRSHGFLHQLFGSLPVFGFSCHEAADAWCIKPEYSFERICAAVPSDDGKEPHHLGLREILGFRATGVFIVHPEPTRC
ncbi:hypothetical protein D3C73_492820 [compost metagenome]